MFNQICFHNGKLFTPIISGRNAFLTVYEHINLPKQNFRELFRLEIPIRSSLKPNTIVVDTTNNSILGLKCIVILVIGFKGDCNVLIYSEVLETLIDIHYLENLSMPIIPNGNIFVTDGPLLVTLSNDLIDFYPFSKINNRISLNISSLFHLKQTKVLQVECIGQIVKNNLFNVIILVLSSTVNNEQEIGILAAEISADTVTNCEELSVKTFFPQFLKSHAKNVHISNLYISRSVSEFEDINWKNNSSVICTISECFICFKGELKYVTVLPFHNVSYIVEDLNPHSLDDSSVILKSCEKEVALLKLNKDSNEFQLKKNWTEIQNIVAGDILMTGSKQLLLLKDGTFNGFQEDYILMDISNFVPIDILDQPNIPVECLNPTISGLNAKLQAGIPAMYAMASWDAKQKSKGCHKSGKLAVAQKVCEIEEKNNAILDALNRLKIDSCDSSEVETSTFQDSLVNLILCNDENNKMDMDKRRDKQSLKILNHWKKFFDNRWFLCWTFKNENDSVICYPALKFVIDNHKIFCCQKIFVHSSSSSFSLEDNSLNQLNPQENFSILSCLEFRHFCAESIKVHAILSWYSGSQEEFQNELFLSQGDKFLPQNQMPLTTSLDVGNILSINHYELPVTEKLFCLRLTNQRMVFKVSSKFSSLLILENILLKSELGSQLLSSIEASSSKILIFKNEISPLFGIHFKFIFLENNDVEIEAFVKNDDDLLLLMQFFHQCFPEDIIIIPCVKTCNEISEMKQKVACAMKEETDFLIASLNAHNISSQIQGNTNTPIQPGVIVIPKNTFLRIRRALIKKEYITDVTLRNISTVEFLNKR